MKKSFSNADKNNNLVGSEVAFYLAFMNSLPLSGLLRGTLYRWEVALTVHVEAPS
jgi:hypothetical protein